MFARRRFLGGALAAAGLAALPALAARPAPRVVMLGDSLTAGFGLPPGQGLVAQLHRWLAARGHRARLIDAGLSGDTSYGGRVRAAWLLDRTADAVVVELGANDMLMGWPVSRTEANLDAILTRAGKGGRPVLLVGIHPHPRVSATAKRDWIALWPRLAARHGALLLPDIYAPIRSASPTRRQTLLQRDGLHASVRGTAAMVDLLGPEMVALLDRVGR
ncbi:GDSL-type esterase/lipase family protein [Paracoccus jiaweipingae]|uniref:GDSL-type esterase/lipase family protein n=1 Tax=unclassified Paracoccus (in: a-proteobacteria) TaxID=2688777 RepID=UPI0037A9F3E4